MAGWGASDDHRAENRSRRSLIAFPMAAPRSVRLCFVAGIAAVFEVSGSAHAQQQPAEIPSLWRFDLTTGIGYDNNLRFRPVMESAVSGRLRAGLTRLLRSPRTNVSLGATGEGSVHRPLREYNGVNYSSDLTASYLVSPRTTLRIGDSFSKSYTSDSRVLIDAGLFLPRTVARSNNASIEASRDISPRWTWSVLAEHTVVHFESNLLIDESSFRARADLSRQSLSASRIGLNYQLGHTDRRLLADSDSHRLALWGQHRFGEKVSVRLDVGASKLLSQGSDAGRVIPGWSAQFDVRSPKQTFSATMIHSLSEAFGLGRLQVRSAASVRFARTLTPRLTAGVNGTLSRSEDPGRDRSRTFETKSVDGDFGFRFAQNVEISLAGGYRKRDSGVESAQSRFATLTIKVGQNW